MAETSKRTGDLADEVYRELVSVRKGEGLCSSAPLVAAPEILQLQCVEDERQRRNFAGDGSRLAAWSAIKCAVRLHVAGSDHREILKVSLNIEFGDSGSPGFNPYQYEAYKDLNLTQRKNFLIESLPISSSTYDRMMQRAYRQLADILVTRKDSPCRETDEFKFMSDSELGIQRLFYYLSTAETKSLREEIAKRLINSPRLAVGAVNTPGINPVAAAGQLLSNYIDLYETTTVQTSADHDQDTSLIPGQYLIASILGGGEVAYPDLVAEIESEILRKNDVKTSSVSLTREGRHGLELTAEYYVVLARSCQVLAQAIVSQSSRKA